MIVRIFDHQYRLSSAAADTAAIQRAAALLDERMRSVAAASRRRIPLEVAVLAAMGVAEELLQALDRRDRVVSEADERLSRFTRLLEDSSPSSSDPEQDPPPAPARF